MDSLWTTVTHARLRAKQGDLAGAERVLDAVLARRPGDAAALSFREELRSGFVAVPAVPVPTPAEDPARAALAADLAERVRREFQAPGNNPRVIRLERWLHRIRRSGRPFLSPTRL